MTRSYWNGTGKHQALADGLNALCAGPITSPITSPNRAFMGRYRQFANAYYDIFNNGGCNMPDDIRMLFGDEIMPLLYEDADWRCDICLPVRDMDWKAIHRITEPRMNRIVLSAAKEQGLLE